MTSGQVAAAKSLILGWYEKNPEMFDQQDNKELFKYFLTNFLGLKLNMVAEMRLEKYSWATIERAARLLVADKKIEMSEENKEARHISAEKTKKAIKEPVNYDDMYEFGADGIARLKQ